MTASIRSPTNLLLVVAGVLASTSEAVDNLRHTSRSLQTYTQTDGYQTKMLELVNEQRANNGLSSLCLNSKLLVSALCHSKDMAAKDYMAHNGSDGSTMEERITQAGFVWTAVGENVAAGQETVSDVMTAWMNSPEHKANILGDYKMLGTAYVYSADSTYQHFWTQDFGTGDDESCTSSSSTGSSSSSSPSADQTQQQEITSETTSPTVEATSTETPTVAPTTSGCKARRAFPKEGEETRKAHATAKAPKRRRRLRGPVSLRAQSNPKARSLAALQAADSELPRGERISGGGSPVVEIRRFLHKPKVVPMRVNVGDEKRSKRKLPAAAAAADEGEEKPLEATMLASHQSKLQLKCKDGTTFDVTYEQAMMSSTLWVLMQDVSGKKPKNGVKQHVIPIFDVPTESVQHALEYCSCLYKQQVDRVESAMLDWEDEFVGLESKELCDLAKVASNLDIQPLVDLTCRSIAQIMSATSEADELRKKFGLQEPPEVECSCELRSDMAGFDFDMFDTLDHDLSTEEYELVEFDQPSVDELVSFINGSGGNPSAASSQIQQQQAAKKNCHLHGENSSDPGDSNNGSTTSSKKKRKKRKKKKSPPSSSQAIDQADSKAPAAIEKSATGFDKQAQESSSSEEDKDEPDPTPTKPSSSRNGKNNKPQTLEEKVRLARQNPSAVFKESQFEDDDDEDMAKVIKMFELNLESAYRDCDKKKKPRLDFAPREVFRSSLVRSSQFEYVQRRLSATMT
ncbi:hypothetical protein PHYPSEUDO_000851 [Phytophthora pseudosyringae]|uniref:SCP domain-containing protein n=1 Tax=Phytophthora pseudosyringae TaxID=221518 RepID=A0A8T1VYI7_9STRA|nr:hypothetical protein PHYPSEUDO_000851 [Phytophthora pseudosyringae]